MRPIRRGPSPRTTDYSDHSDAKPDLQQRLGPFCSYCERFLPTMLAVEHVQAKTLHPALIGRWENFLLACVNCNSTKKTKDPALDEILIPDRDNTMLPLEYLPDGTVVVAHGLSDALMQLGDRTLGLTGLSKRGTDRARQRQEAWAIAQEAKSDVDSNPGNEAVRRLAAKLAEGRGFFSVWMAVFAGDADMRNRLIDAFPGTRASGCFDANGNMVTPAPNPDGLPDGGKC